MAPSVRALSSLSSHASAALGKATAGVIAGAAAPRPIESLEPRKLLAAGDLTTSFGAGGIRAFDFDAQFVQTILQVEEAPGGNLYVAGFSNSADGENNREYLARLTPGGDLDTSFNGNGILELAGTGAAENITQILALDDGDLLVVRQQGTGSDILRINPDGSPDTDHFAVIPVSFPATVVATQLGGEDVYVAAGNPGNDPTNGALVNLYLSDGEQRAVNGSLNLLSDELDSFAIVDLDLGSDGESVYVLGSGPASPASMLSNSVRVFKVDLGPLDVDTTFGNNGFVEQDFDFSDAFAPTSVDVDSRNRVVVGIDEDDGESQIIRYAADGKSVDFERRFSFTPYVFGNGNDIRRVMVQADNKILVGGFVQDDEGDTDAVFIRFAANGTRDAEFAAADGNTGERSYDLGTAGDLLTYFDITADGSIVGVGRRRTGPPTVQYDNIAFKVDLKPITPDDPNNFARLEGQKLIIEGTAVADEFTFSRSGDAYTFRRITGGESLQQTFTAGTDFTSVLVLAGEGNDRVLFSGLMSGFGDGTAAVEIRGEGGDDELVGSGGQADLLLGGTGNDILTSNGNGAASLRGDDGNDQLTGGSNDTLLGGNGNDTLTGGDRAEGEGGNDTISGATFALGGSGNDTLDLPDNGSANAGPGTDVVRFNLTSTSRSIVGGSDDDTFVVQSAGGGTRTDLAAQLDGSSGEDTLDLTAFSYDLLGQNPGVSVNGFEQILTGGGLGSIDNRVLTLNGTSGADTFAYSTSGGAVLIQRTGSDPESATFNLADFDRVILRAGDGNDQINFADFLKPADLRGEAGNDLISGGAQADTLLGGAGNDTIRGDNDSAADVLDGGDGDDQLFGAGQDTQLGGLGTDRFTASVSIEDLGNSGTLFLEGLVGQINISGTEGVGTVTVGDSEVASYSGVGTFQASAAGQAVTVDSVNYTLLGGSGSDTLLAGNRPAAVNGGGGNDVISVNLTDALVSLTGGAGDDFVTLLDGTGGAMDLDATLNGGDGNDTLDLLQLDPPIGVPNDSTLVIDGFEDVRFNDEQPGQLFDFSDSDVPVTVTGTGGRDTIIGSRFDDVLVGGDGSDIIIGGGGNDSIDGGTGNDTISGGDGDDTLVGGEGNDSIRGGRGADLLDGGTGNDRLLPGLSTGEGDTVLGGDGTDLVDYGETAANQIIIAGDDITDVEWAYGGSGNYRIEGFVRIRAGAGNDTLVGASGQASALFGGEGNDRLSTAGDVGGYLDGGAGDDTLVGSTGNDTLVGGEGTDALSDPGGVNDLDLHRATVSITLDLTQDGNLLLSSSGLAGSITGSYRNVAGGSAGDTITASTDGGWINGNGGDDLLTGGPGKDILVGGGGDDTLSGNGDNDLLIGEFEFLSSVFARNTLTGGAGDDIGVVDDDDDVSEIETLLSDPGDVG